MHRLTWTLALLLSSGCASRLPADLLLIAPEWAIEETAQSPHLDSNELARVIHDKVNGRRKQHGLHPLVWSEKLLHIAMLHSKDMAQHSYFGHTNLQGMEPSDRACDVGHCAQIREGEFAIEGVGENILFTHRYTAYTIIDQSDGTRSYQFEWKSIDCLGEEALTLWLDSPAHRKNLLSPVYRSAGIGIVHAENETLFVTQILSPSTTQKIASL